MRLKRFCVSSLFLFLCVEGVCCGPYFYTPQEYYMYRVYDRSDESARHPEYYENCLAWQAVTSTSIPVEDIREVVYRYSIEQTRAIMTRRQPSNAFAGWIKEHGDQEIVDFLLLAKSCEKTRATKASRWYYPSKNDEVLMTLEMIRDSALSYEGVRLRDRYGLQAARAMHSLGDFCALVDWWDTTSASIGRGVVRDMIEGYVTGALFNLGEDGRALAMVARMSDITSIRRSLSVQGHAASDVDVLGFIADNCPDNPEVHSLLQSIFYGMEDNVVDYAVWSGTDPERRSSLPRISEEDARTYMDICMRAATSELCEEPAVWYYTAAYVMDLQGRTAEAARLIARAETSEGPIFIRESVKVMRIYLDARNARYDRSYDARLLKDLTWLDEMMASRLTPAVRSRTAEMWRVEGNHSYYYWGDMMRRIVLGEVCPRMLEAGRTRTALALANYADNRLVDLVDSYETSWYKGRSLDRPKMFTMEEYRHMTDVPNWHDYSGCFFDMMDEADVSALIAYVSSFGKASSAVDRFLDERGYYDSDYFNELIGTKFLRRMDYPKAVTYLSNVSPGYQYRTNLNSYMDRNPFEYEHVRASHSIPEYKLNFAREMVEYQRQAASSDRDKAALAKVMMGVGMRSSFDFCWALTRYHLSEADDWPHDGDTMRALRRATSLMSEGLCEFRDKELAAKCHAMLCQWRTAARLYPETETAEWIRSGCDRLVDYDLGTASRWIGY